MAISEDRILAADSQRFSEYLQRMQTLFVARNAVYRSQFRKEGVGAILGWIRTKIQRLAVGIRGNETDDESLSENFLDIAVYGVLGAMVCDEVAEAPPCSHLLAETESGSFVCILCGGGFSGKLSALG